MCLFNCLDLLIVLLGTFITVRIDICLLICCFTWCSWLLRLTVSILFMLLSVRLCLLVCVMPAFWLLGLVLVWIWMFAYDC